MSYILIVEDDQNTADMMTRILEAEGFEVRHTIKGLEGLQEARHDRPDLIFMDFNLPDIDGRSMIIVFRKQLGDAVAPPIVAVTAHASEQQEYIARRFGCADFIAKPFQPERLVEVARTYVDSGSVSA